MECEWGCRTWPNGSAPGLRAPMMYRSRLVAGGAALNPPLAALPDSRGFRVGGAAVLRVDSSPVSVFLTAAAADRSSFS